MQLRGCGSGCNDSGRLRSSRSHTIDFTCLRTVLRNVADLSTPVARLASFVVDSAAVRGRAIARDVAQLAAGVALHGLGLAVASEVVGPSALVAGRGASIATAVATAHAATAACKASARRAVRAVALCVRSARAFLKGLPSRTHSEVTKLAASIAARVASTAQAQGGAISLHMAETLTVVTLLCWSVLSAPPILVFTSCCGLLSVVRGWGQLFDSWPMKVD